MAVFLDTAILSAFVTGIGAVMVRLSKPLDSLPDDADAYARALANLWPHQGW